MDFVSEDVLVTVGLDKTVKLWKISDDLHELIGKTGVSLISSHKHKEDIVSVKYSHKNQMLLFMDKECSLGVISLNLNSLKKKEASENDSLDVEMVDLNDLDLDDVKDAINDVKESSKADAEKKSRLSFTMMEGSKIGKAAESDLILGLGRHNAEMETNEPDHTRFVTISKNKLSGWHGTIICNIEPEVSRYVE